MRAARVPAAKAFQCPNCAGTIELRGHGNAINAVCSQCLSIIDSQDANLRILQRFEERQRRQPLIPLGTRGKLNDIEYEVIGFQVRGIDVDGESYEWSEYLLYNPYHGYRYLTEYEGHWNSIQSLRALPEPSHRGKKKAAVLNGKVYTHFQTAEASTVYVMGEFPWQVRAGETVVAEDYIDPPHVISSETTADEVIWSGGVYTPPDVIWKAFGLHGSPRRPSGIYANQPSPHQGKIRSAWVVFFVLFGILIAGMIGTYMLTWPKQVYSDRFSFNTIVPGERSFVTPYFELAGRTSNVDIQVSTDLNNNWAYFSFALINDDTGVAYDVGKEISYYYGRDSDGNWSEGGQGGSLTIPSVPSGRYYLRVEPDMDPARVMNYRIIVTRGVPAMFWFIVGFVLLLIPPIIVSWRAFSFENQRWAESDYGAMVSSSSSDD
ncbi:MAG TPA: DUF4178 domain-containing protein [Bryobacteraceae bacterium]|nr:DUF4178 domain-containing protein [Bryobacteraceae bacterium]